MNDRPAETDGYIWFSHYLARILVDGETSGGAFAMIEMRSKRMESPLHLHNKEHETFFVLDGELEINNPGKSVHLGPGETYFSPRGVPQMYKVLTEEARWLIVVAPAGFEQLIRNASVPAERLEVPDVVPAVASMGNQSVSSPYGIEYLGPPGTMP